MTPPTIHDVMRARRRVRAAGITATPLLNYPALDAVTGVTTMVKQENLQPIGAFKVRGGINLLASMTEAERSQGLLGYSTGNHAQSLAYAAARFGAPCTIVMPEGANPVKVRAVRGLGAELVQHGVNFDVAKPFAERLAEERGLRLINSGSQPELISGVATAYVEIVESEPDVDVIIVPVGSGSGAAAACLVTAALHPRCRVIAVQSSSSPAGHDSWRAGTCVSRDNQSIAEGLATGSGFEMPQQMIAESLDDFVLVDDAEIRHAQWLLMSRARTVAETAGAASLAALLKFRRGLAGQKVAIMCSGGNASEDELRACMS